MLSEIITSYIKNEAKYAVFFLAADKRNPPNKSAHLRLSWNYDGKAFSTMETVEVTLT